MKGLKPEKNTIISKFSALKIEAKNAFESQALLELKNNYCESKRCLDCAIGSQLLKYWRIYDCSCFVKFILAKQNKLEF
mgnify:FL=1